MRETTSSDEGKARYGMEFVCGRKGITDREFRRIRNRALRLVERLNSGENVERSKIEVALSG